MVHDSQTKPQKPICSQSVSRLGAVGPSSLSSSSPSSRDSFLWTQHPGPSWVQSLLPGLPSVLRSCSRSAGPSALPHRHLCCGDTGPTCPPPCAPQPHPKGLLVRIPLLASLLPAPPWLLTLIPNMLFPEGCQQPGSCRSQRPHLNGLMCLTSPSSFSYSKFIFNFQVDRTVER